MPRARVMHFAVLVGGLFANVASVEAQERYDTVELEGGGFIRGTIVSWIPGEELVIELPDGQTRTFPGAQVVSVRRADGVTEAPDAGDAPEASAPALGAPLDEEPTFDVEQPTSSEATPSWGTDPEGGPEQYAGAVWTGIYGGLGPHIRSDVPGPPVDFMGYAGFHVDLRPPGSIYRFRIGGQLRAWGPGSRIFVLHLEAMVWVLGLDLGDWITARLGGMAGLGWMESFGSIDLCFGPALEVAATLLDRHLELGVHFSMPFWELGGVQEYLAVFAAYSF